MIPDRTTIVSLSNFYYVMSQALSEKREDRAVSLWATAKSCYLGLKERGDYDTEHLLKSLNELAEWLDMEVTVR